MVVESDPFKSGRRSIGFKYRRIDMRPAIAFQESGIRRATKMCALHTRTCFVLNIPLKNIRCNKNVE